MIGWMPKVGKLSRIPHGPGVIVGDDIRFDDALVQGRRAIDKIDAGLASGGCLELTGILLGDNIHIRRTRLDIIMDPTGN